MEPPQVPITWRYRMPGGSVCDQRLRNESGWTSWLIPGRFPGDVLDRVADACGHS